ncbi:MAG TPA: hypothetical protein VGI93_13290 [Steroidobacteraceae bacterium]|jgi:hypothetical protein
MKKSVALIAVLATLSGCQTVSQADLYQANFGRAVMPASNFDPAMITNGPYNPYNQKQTCSVFNPACAPSARDQWKNEFY